MNKKMREKTHVRQSKSNIYGKFLNNRAKLHEQKNEREIHVIQRKSNVYEKFLNNRAKLHEQKDKRENTC